VLVSESQSGHEYLYYHQIMMGAAKSALGIGGDKPMMKAASFYELKAKTAEGVAFEFSQLKGKVVIISNVASKCGLTDSMYKALGTAAQKYGPSNEFVVLGFPCGQFMNQEFKSTEETCPFVRGLLAKFGDIQDKKYFVLMEKVNVNGPETHEVFQFIKYNSSLYKENDNLNGPISWNFGKFLIDREGRVIKYYAPTDDKIDADIQAALDGKLSGKPFRPQL
jgi:glutathione peroxidase-family protein